MKVSIIIPVYNTKEYLSDCLDSLLTQDGTINDDYEIICVDDGSTDQSLEVLNKYKEKGIIVISQKNEGVSSARNRGLLFAKGDFVWFVDSDDFVDEHALEIAYKELGEDKTTVLTFQYASVDVSSKPDNIQNIISKAAQLLPWRCIVSRYFLLENNIRFNTNMQYGEDTLWIFFLKFFHCNIKELNSVFYYYRMNPTSVMHQKNTKLKHFDSMYEMLKVYVSLYSEYKNKSSFDVKNLRCRIYWSIQNVLFDAIYCKSEKERKLILDELKAEELYPYPLQWNRISLKYGMKNFLVNMFSLLFPCKYYYQFICKIFRFFG